MLKWHIFAKACKSLRLKLSSTEQKKIFVIQSEPILCSDMALHVLAWTSSTLNQLLLTHITTDHYITTDKDIVLGFTLEI